MNHTFKDRKVLYLGFNNMLKHKRGVENVIDFQSKASISDINYYIHWDDRTSVYKYKGFLCIGIKSNVLKYFVFNWFMMRIKRREKSIFIHSHNTLMSMTCIFQTHLFTVHDALYYQNKAIKHKLLKVFYFLERFLYTRVGHVHFISDFTKKMSLLSETENFTIIHNTSHLEDFELKAKLNDEDELITKFNATKTKVFVVRSMEGRSRIDLIIKVAEQLKDRDFEIFIAGKGPLYDFYNNQIERLNIKNITLLGYVSDANLIRYYSVCDMVLMPAEYAEGFGLPIIEGYLFNKPVIASHRCAIPEVIISEDFLFDNTVESIVEKLEFAQKKLKGPYKEFYNHHFSNVHILSQFNALYKNLM
jgi:glycosyltransferase involved in cell wall biosynthesis